MSKSRLKQRSAKSYTPEFRIQAIKLAQGKEKSISQTARDLGVPLATLHTWVRKAEKGEWSIAEDDVSAIKIERPVAGPGGKTVNISQKLHEQLSAEQKKSQELERQVRRLMQEREILKKAMAYCLDVPK
ncbi:MAG: transposase [Proteobacteria bacterium]|nr:transposase [Pseudomonadota bacterium]